MSRIYSKSQEKFMWSMYRKRKKAAAKAVAKAARAKVTAQPVLSETTKQPSQSL